MRGPCWVADVDSVPGLSSHSLRHLTTTPRGAIGCDPVSQNRAWVQKRKEDYPRPRLSNKQELLTARPQSLQSVKRRWKKQRLCPFTIYLQIQRWEQLARNLAHTSHSTCAASPTEALPGQPLSQLWEQAESCKPCSKILSPTFTRATELALQYQLQRCRCTATLSPRLSRGRWLFLHSTLFTERFFPYQDISLQLHQQAWQLRFRIGGSALN